jgi:hypothetical protein
MQPFWNRTEGRTDRVEWTGPLQGIVESITSTGQQPTPGLTLRTGNPPGIVLELAEIDYSASRVEHVVRPVGGNIFIQEPFILAPQQITSDVGLRLILGVMADKQGIMMDARLETIAPLERVSLSLSIQLHPDQDCYIRPPVATWPNDSLVVAGTDARWMHVYQGHTLVAGLVCDLGDAGFALGDRHGKRWELTLFEQPLEKGVILVGRWGFVPAPRGVSERELHQAGQKLLDRPTFL